MVPTVLFLTYTVPYLHFEQDRFQAPLELRHMIGQSEVLSNLE